MKKLILLLAINCLFMQQAVAQDDCVFDENSFDPSWVKNHPALNKHTPQWNKKDGTLRFFDVVGTGSALTVLGGGCTHYSEVYTLNMPNTPIQVNPAELKKQALNLAKLTLNADDYQRLKKKIIHTNLNKLINLNDKVTGKSLMIDHPDYPEFYLTIWREPLKKTKITMPLTIQIGWYVN